MMGNTNTSFPSSLLSLSLISSILSLFIIALSSFNYCFLSLAFNSFTVSLTVFYHGIIALLVWSNSRKRRRFPNSSPDTKIFTESSNTKPHVHTALSVKCVTLSAVICVLWIIATSLSLKITVQGSNSGSGTSTPSSPPTLFLWRRTVQIVATSLAGIEVLVMGTYLQISVLERGRCITSDPPDSARNIIKPTTASGRGLDDDQDTEGVQEKNDDSRALTTGPVVANFPKPVLRSLPRALFNFNSPLSRTETRRSSWSFVTGPGVLPMARPPPPASRPQYNSVASVDELWM